MEDIILSEVNVAEFAAYFDKLARQQKAVFAKERRDEILALHNPDILSFLCARGYFCFLGPLFKIGNEEQTRKAFVGFYGRKKRGWMIPSREDERMVIEMASKRLDLVRFLCEETEFFCDEEWYPKGLKHIIYRNAPVECLDYLFNQAIRNSISVSRLAGVQLFSRASVPVIRKYISKIAFFSGELRGINFTHIKSLYDRPDIPREVKMELIFAAINHFRVGEQVITKMRKAGMFKG